MNNTKTQRPITNNSRNFAKTVKFTDAISKITMPDWDKANPAQKELIRSFLNYSN